MMTPVGTLAPGATLGDAVDLLLRTAQKEFPILDGAGRPRGLLTKDALIGALREAGPSAPVADSMVREVPSLPAWRPLEAGLATLNQAKAPALFVLDDHGRLVGVVTPENVGEMMLVRSVRPDFRFRRLRMAA
jgi:CBS domain-containing protein